MLKEIYCRNSQDPGYTYNQLETSSGLEAILTKIRMILFTTPGDVMGEYNLGLDLERKLFTFNFNATDLQSAFREQLTKYVPEATQYNVDIKVNFVPGTVRDIAYIDIYIDNTRALGVAVK